MTLEKAISRFREMRDAPLDDKYLTERISELDGTVKSEVTGETGFRGYNYLEDRKSELAIPFPDTELYFLYLSMCCDLIVGDAARYNLSASAFESAWKSFADRYTREHKPKSSAFVIGGAIEHF